MHNDVLHFNKQLSIRFV